MKNIILAATLVAVSASQASALSCIRPDVATAFKDASDSDRNYVVLKGTFEFTPPAKTDKPQAETVDSQFRGRLLTGGGFTQTVSAPVEIDMTCAGEWCAQVDPNVEYIAFVENIDNERLIFEVGPCYGFAFKEPAQEAVKRLENCAQGGACEPATE
ncbi:hypothetical protein [uncultured Litoreibacter sp.]|uniref:hypothetical protein n=1 Tax=uncultured Litoreibacter sp. TaxID=1392394 RepID=UPI00262F9840|nr:hypothetical protein [uncultured Litoreibacter sp.]